MKRISIRHRYEGVCPSIVHANGVANTRLWEIIRDQFFVTAGKFNPVCDHGQQQDWTKELTVLTWNTTDNVGTFERSCKTLGIPAYVMTKKIEVTTPNTRITYPAKILTTIEMLPQVKTKYVMMVDSFDAIMLENPARILEAYLNKPKSGKIVFSAEMGHFPSDSPTKDMEFKRTTNKRCFLNAGFCIGETNHVLQLYQRAKEHGDEWDHRCLLTDQAAIKKAYVSDFWDQIELDYNAQMCLNLYGTKAGELELLYVNNGIRLETV